MTTPKAVPEEVDSLYQPSISDLELDEHQGVERPVIYLDSAKAALAAREERIRQATIKEVVERVQADVIGEPEPKPEGIGQSAKKSRWARNHLRRKQRAALKKIEKEM